MAYGKRRHDCSRDAMLLMLIDNRTRWGDDDSPTKMLDWFPADLLEVTDVEAFRIAEQKSVRKMSMGEMIAMQGLESG